ncbi:hypothetical protein Sango_2783400 [Sesamum angolense]|uniref:RNase H type-1 domain-containing protein n=1 Tax=Sesamum angolense TaxID=2727404 RepID=A0AAE1T8W2_9LAMI|nr:hypothetical protein Sango_2783400 [Sesamum angolense]
MNIWTDPWVPRTPSFRVITPKSPDDHILYVSELILPDTGEWDVELINALFWPEDRALILQIPLSRVGMADLLVWHYSPNGLFSVRSAYDLALSLASSAGSSNARWCRNTWRAVCKLMSRTSAESPIYTLLRCSFARQVWALSGVRWNDIDSLAWSMEEWIQSLTLKLSATDFSLVFNTISVSLHLLPLGIPPSECIKINFDGGIRDGGRALGLGALARNSEGACLAWLSLKLDRGSTAEMAEGFAAREAISLALRQRWRHVILEGDSSTLLHKLGSTNIELSVISPLVADIHSLSSQFESVSFSLVSRACNSAADLLARLALNQSGDSIWFPPGLNAVLWGDLTT